MDEDVFNGLTYGGNDEWDDEVDENIQEEEDANLVVTSPPPQVRSAVKVAAIKDPLNWFHNIPVAAKKSKIESNSGIFALTTKRIEEAKIKRKTATADQTNQTFDKEKPQLLRYPPLRGSEWMGISCPDNLSRRYVTLMSGNKEQAKKQLIAKNSSVRQTIHKLLLEFTPRIMEDMEVDSTFQNCDTKLWIDKYAPKSFFDLLTQDANNRLSLNWLNLWNEYIFNKPSVYERLTQTEQQLLEIEDIKPFLPKRKVMLIHGGSGCGKSSLAIMTAKVKFDPFIINMNEITNVTELNRVLMHAMTYHTLSFNPASRKPRCLILDGLEYATVEIINALKKWILNRKKDDALRPIIGTCNNVYTPSLRDFRNICFLLKATVDETRLLDRVYKICLEEKLKINNLMLKNFVAQAQGDIRLCLNNLQFQCSRKSSSLTKKEIDLKNSELSIFEALDSVLYLNKHIDRKGFVKAPKERFETLSLMIGQRSDTERFSNIIFNNIPEACKPSPKQLLKADKWFVEADIVGALAYAYQDYSLLRHQNCALVGVHFATACNSRRAKISITVTNVAEACRNVTSMLNTVRLSKANMKHPLSITRLVIDVLPSYFYIIQPPMQISDSLMFKNEGSEKINRIVSLMAGYGIMLKPGIDNGAMDYTFDPPINEIVSYRLLFGHHNLSLPSSAKAYIARQLEMHVTLNAIDGGSIITSTAVIGEKYIPPNPDIWCFRYSSATAQSIKRAIKFQALMPNLQ